MAGGTFKSESQIAYEEFRAAAGRVLPDGSDLPEWGAVPPRYQAAVSAGLRAVDAARGETPVPHPLPAGRVYREDK